MPLRTTQKQTHQFLVHVGLAFRSVDVLEDVFVRDLVRAIGRGQEKLDELAVFDDSDLAVHVEAELGTIAC